MIAVRLLDAVQAGSEAALCRGARRVVAAALGALRSPLAAAQLAAAYRRMQRALLPNHLGLADTVARLTIRLVRHILVVKMFQYFYHESIKFVII